MVILEYKINSDCMGASLVHLGGCCRPPMSSAFHTDSGTTWAHDGVTEVGREKPVIAFLMASTSAAGIQQREKKTA